MAMFENFPYTNLQEINLAWLIDAINKVKEGQVISVNGETGEVTLYENASVQFPDVSSPVWNVVRNANGHRVGIAFHDNGNAYILHDGYQFQIYNADNPPPYPVTSVNGQTGAVVLYENAVVQLPALNDNQLMSWRIYREINGTNRGIKFDTDGKAYIIDGTPGNDQIYTTKNPPFEGDLEIHFPNYDDPAGTYYLIGRYFNNNWLGFKIYADGHTSIMTDDNTEYPLYIQGINDPSDFNNPADIIMEIKTALPSGTEWGIIRKCSGVDVGLLFKFNSLTLEWDAYIKKDNTLTKLLTINDIPSGTGVVSINTKTGVVTLYGNEILLGVGISETVTQAISSLRSTNTLIESGLVIVADGLTHEAIKTNQLIYVKNNNDLAEGFYKATSNILANAVVDNANTTPINNVLDSKANALTAGTYTNSFIRCFGYVANNGQELQLFVPLMVSQDVSNINITSCIMSIRSPTGGFIGSANYEAVNDISATSLTWVSGGLNLVISKTGAWTNAINNSCVAGSVTLSFTLS